MNDQSVLTRATPKDLSTLLELIREFCAIDGHNFDEQRLCNALPALLETDEYGLVWLIDNPADGYAVVTWGYSLESGGREALIDEIYLRSRERGMGSVAIAEILNDCRQRGLKSVFLETEAHNGRVRRFYERAGFRKDDSVWMSLPLETPQD